MNTETFIKTQVNIDYLLDEKRYYLFPHKIHIIKKDDTIENWSVKIKDVDRTGIVIAKAIKDEAKKIISATNYPPTGDIKTDFVAVTTYTPTLLKITIIPYDSFTGKKLNTIFKGQVIDNLKEHFNLLYDTVKDWI